MSYIIKHHDCPDCMTESLTYNGNYYCTNCTWINSEVDIPLGEESTFIIKLQVDYMRQTRNETNRDRYDFYLRPLEAELKKRRS